MIILRIKNSNVECNGKMLFEINNIYINDGDLIGIIGKNGSGKTTLLSEIYNQIKNNKQYSNSIELIKFNDNLNMNKSGGEMVVQKLLESFSYDKKIYLLDEPTTYLDKNNINKIANIIKRKNSIFCIATHDRYFLDKICNKIWIIENETLVEFNGKYSEYLEQREVDIRTYNTNLDKYYKERKKVQDSIRKMKETQQSKKGKPKNMSASDYRMVGVKTKISNNQKKLQKNIVKQNEKLNDLVKPKKVIEDYNIDFLDIFKIKNRKSFYISEKEFFINNNLLWKSPNITFSSGDRFILIGRNGSGKTTFLNYVKSQIPTTYKVSYFEQNNLDLLNRDISIIEYIRGFTNLDNITLRNILALLNFRGSDIDKKIKNLSNGEKVKLYFISLLFQESDVLLLDEITNFLDIVTIEAVEKILKKYPGILIMVSHDNNFIKNVSTKIIEFNIGQYIKFII
ncbi:ABC-F family ATP-binding cassette domain-containing protein [Gemella palaticanis]|uniref:ABC-F family ATP-binding cassette domain-containing protein n=2 Tax=Gemelliphila palaticanis TaxID=81950 RepID=A0ABX2SY77_9BACL|nr:ABC-F family ATP-binding cassette domain-containing protein [Gemella palaticanis]NYS46938.1 ABC-F family ATP-binding cassette domain-containing protein [Gemella palaticanis]